MALTTLVVVVALLVGQSLLGFTHSTKAAGGGGGNGCAGIPQGICQYKGNTAEADFNEISPDGCIQTSFHLTVSEDVTTTPPDPRVSGKTAFAYLNQYDACNNVYVLALTGFASTVDFQATRVTQATLDATVEADDGNGNIIPMVVQLSWQGIGGTATSIQDDFFRSPAEVMHSKFTSISRQATVTGSITVGTTVFTLPGDGAGDETVTALLYYVQQGTLELYRS